VPEYLWASAGIESDVPTSCIVLNLSDEEEATHHHQGIVAKAEAI
jgi:hypothetical protein